MKIEKITDNTIRIVLKEEDIKEKKINMQKLLSNTPESQNLFLEMLTKAKKEVNFETDGHKLLIETFLQEDTCIFTITKYLEPTITKKNKKKKYLTVKKRSSHINSQLSIYQFNDFEDFCNLCTYINKNNSGKFKNIFKTATLYYYNTSYYLVIDGINLSHQSLGNFHSTILEFSESFTYTKNFKFKLVEHGKIAIKNNAISTGIKYFSKTF